MHMHVQMFTQQHLRMQGRPDTIGSDANTQRHSE